MTACGGPSTGRPHSLRSWRLPGLLLPSGISDDHDRLEPRRSSSTESARHVVLRTALLARRGGARPPHKRPPPPGAPRLLPPPRGRAVQDDRPGRRDRQVSLRPVLGEWVFSSVAKQMWRSSCSARPRRAIDGARNTKRQKKRGRCSEASTRERGSSPVWWDPVKPYSSSTGSSRRTFTFFPTHSAGR